MTSEIFSGPGSGPDRSGTIQPVYVEVEESGYQKPCSKIGTSSGFTLGLMAGLERSYEFMAHAEYMPSETLRYGTIAGIGIASGLVGMLGGNFIERGVRYFTNLFKKKKKGKRRTENLGYDEFI